MNVDSRAPWRSGVVRAREDGSGRRTVGFEDNGELRVHRRMVVCPLNANGVETSVTAGGGGRGERMSRERRLERRNVASELVKLVVEEGETARHVSGVTQIGIKFVNNKPMYVHMEVVAAIRSAARPSRVPGAVCPGSERLVP